MANQDDLKKSRPLSQEILKGLALLSIASLVLLSLIFLSLDDLPSVFRSLPSDEEMVSNFNKHRADFERLAQIYREDLSVPTDFLLLEPTPEVKAIMDRIDVRSVWGDGRIWVPPDPYSKEADFLKEKWRVKSYCPEGRRFSGVVFRPTHGKTISLRYGFIHKHYYYLPFVPKIVDGSIILPTTPAGGYPRVVETLNKYPAHFRSFECLCRQIEPHWFIEMCRE